LALEGLLIIFILEILILFFIITAKPSDEQIWKKKKRQTMEELTRDCNTWFEKPEDVIGRGRTMDTLDRDGRGEAASPDPHGND